MNLDKSLSRDIQDIILMAIEKSYLDKSKKNQENIRIFDENQENQDIFKKSGINQESNSAAKPELLIMQILNKVCMQKKVIDFDDRRGFFNFFSRYVLYHQSPSNG